MARPAGLEPAAFCLEATHYKTLSAASGVAYEEARHFISPLNWTELGLKLEFAVLRGVIPAAE
jgi:hypothetical protein